MDWFAAAEAAADTAKCGVQGYLASILSPEEQTAISNEASSNRFWIGLNDLGTTEEGKFGWLFGPPTWQLPESQVLDGNGVPLGPTSPPYNTVYPNGAYVNWNRWRAKQFRW